MVAIVAAFIVLQAAAGAFYTIKPGEVGIVLRFGQYHRTTTPGLHFKIPYVEEMTKDWRVSGRKRGDFVAKVRCIYPLL